ncbi:acyltransferase [Lactobacillus sp. DCY120]|uniref:Acyltransferase n=1 Tax=Bombilactobacillus apium TaxID=2675299 RepID=A0A850R9X3_9LACO|nr:acyltransferase [Bombilactobacillus apium]NVY96186.1 acyltransferase [Bombilactobacillus apium]
MNQNSKYGHRNSNLEALRIIAMFLIVLGHFAIMTNWHFQGTSLGLIAGIQWLWFGGKLGVNLFVLISAYFLSQSTRSRPNGKTLLRLWTQVYFYSLLSFIIGSYVLKINFGAREIMRSFFPLTMGTYWFATAYFCIVVLAPYLNLWIRQLSFKSYSGLLLFLALIATIECTVGSNAIGLLQDTVAPVIFLYLLGGYIRKYQDRWAKIPSFCLFLAIIISLGGMYLSSLGIDFVHLTHPQIVQGFGWAQKYYPSVSPFQLIAASAIFLLFLRLPPHHNHPLNFLARGTFGVYLLHTSVLAYSWLWNDFIKAGEHHPYTPQIFLEALAVSFIILIGGIAVDLIRQGLFRAVQSLFRKIWPRSQGRHKLKKSYSKLSD